MLSNSSKYAVKSVLYLALHSSEENKIVVKDIAAPINVPGPYIAKLLQELVKGDVVSSIRGPKGGFYLSEENRSLPVISILNIIDGEKRLTSCLLSLEKCNEDKPCPLHNILSISRKQILESLNSKTINELAEDIKNGNSFLPL